MIPTIGRIVIYTPTEIELQEMKVLNSNGYGNIRKKLPAIIVGVNESAKNCTVNIRVMHDDDRADKRITSVKQGDGEGQWNWPPRV